MLRRSSALAGLAFGIALAVGGSGVAFASSGDQGSARTAAPEETIVKSDVLVLRAWDTVVAPSVSCPAATKLSDHEYYPDRPSITPGVELIVSSPMAAILLPKRDEQNDRIGIGKGSLIENGAPTAETAQLVLHCVAK